MLYYDVGSDHAELSKATSTPPKVFSFREGAKYISNSYFFECEEHFPYL
jgi:hypothetical protein